MRFGSVLFSSVNDTKASLFGFYPLSNWLPLSIYDDRLMEGNDYDQVLHTKKKEKKIEAPIILHVPTYSNILPNLCHEWVELEYFCF